MTTLIIMLQPECEGCRGENRRSQTVQGNKVTFSRYFNDLTCHICILTCCLEIRLEDLMFDTLFLIIYVIYTENISIL